MKHYVLLNATFSRRNDFFSFHDSSIGTLRAERLQREAEERKRTQALLDQKSGAGKEKREREMGDRDRPYNTAYFPELARKRQRRDGYQNGFY